MLMRPAFIAISTMYQHHSGLSILSPTTITGRKQRDQVDSPTESVIARRDGGLRMSRKTYNGLWK